MCVSLINISTDNRYQFTLQHMENIMYSSENKEISQSQFDFMSLAGIKKKTIFLENVQR